MTRPRDVLSLAVAFDDGRVVLVDGDFLGIAKIGQRDVFQLQAQVLGDGLAAGQNRDVLQHCLAAVAKARSLDGGHVQRAAQLVDHQGRQCLTVDVFGDDHQRTAALGNLLEQRQKVLHAADLLFVDQDDGVFQNRFHALGVGHKVRRQVAAVKLHAFDHFQLRLHGLGFFHGDDAVLADLLHRFGNDVANGLIVVGGDGAHLGDQLFAVHRLAQLVERARNAVAFLVRASR